MTRRRTVTHTAHTAHAGDRDGPCRRLSGRHPGPDPGGIQYVGKRDGQGVGEFGQLLPGGTHGPLGPVLGERTDAWGTDTRSVGKALRGQMTPAHGLSQESFKVCHCPHLPRPGTPTPPGGRFRRP